MAKIKKAIVAVAGSGTRLLPATKSMPKEMLPIVDKPIIQLVVEELVDAGIEDIIFVTRWDKKPLEDHFDRNFELEYRLEQKKKLKELEEIKAIGKLAKFAFVRQTKPLGDGHAVLSALPFVSANEPVAVLFGDDIIDSKKPGIGQMIETYEHYHDSVICIEGVPKDQVSKYGVVGGTLIQKNVMEIDRFVEKPEPKKAPSNLAVIGRYVITPEIMEILKQLKPGKDGEIRLADAFVTALQMNIPVYGRILEGKRHDCGNKLKYVIAQIELGLKHPDIGKDLKNYLKKL